MTAIRVTLILALVACVAWGQRVAEHHSEDTAVRSVSWPIAPTATPPRLPADGRMTQAVRPSSADRLHAVRVAKCARVWQTFAPWSYSPDLVDFFISECERWGIGDQWLPLLTYGMANFGLRVGATAPGKCYGPWDVKHPYWSREHAAHVMTGPKRESALRDPYVNTACHVGQAAEYHRRTGRTGMALLRTVFYPAAPWGAATNAWAPRWEKWDRKFRACIARGYEVGKLPGPGGNH